MESFLTWLAETAKGRGHKLPHEAALTTHLAPESSSPGRLKGKARKAAKQSANINPQTSIEVGVVRQLSLKDFAACAQTLARARSPKVTTSPSVLALAHRALSLRKRCTSWFSKQKQAAEDVLQGNHSLRYFNCWLEDILTILKPCGDAFAIPKEAPNASQYDSSNRFASLNVEDPITEHMPIKAAKATNATEGLPAPLPSPRGIRYRIKSQEREKEIIENWLGYRVGHRDLVSASLATNMVRELCVQVEAEFRESFPELNSIHKVLVRLLRVLQSPKLDGSDLSVRLGDNGAILLTEVLNEWLLIPCLYACSDLWQQHDDTLVTWGMLNDHQIYQRIQQEPSIHNSQYPKVCALPYMLCLYSVAGEVAILKFLGDELPIEDLFTQTLRAGPGDLLDRSVSDLFAAQAFLDVGQIMGDRIGDPYHELDCCNRSLNIKFEMSECTPAIERGIERIGRWLNQDQIQLMRATLSQHHNGARGGCCPGEWPPLRSSSCFQNLQGTPIALWAAALGC